MSRPRIPDAERIELFWSLVDKNGPVAKHAPELGPCWLWTGKLDTSGYGFVEGEKDRAHRKSFFIEHPEAPRGVFVCHLCDVAACCRSSHLYAGNALTNARDVIDRARRSPPPTFADEESRRIATALRSARYEAGLSQDRLAMTLGCSFSSISRVERGQHVPKKLAEAWAEACGVPVDQLWSEIDARTAAPA